MTKIYIILIYKDVIMKLNINNKYKAVAYNWEQWEFTLKDLLSFSDKTILYFYPMDDTPWCTIENKDFSSMKDEFKNKWVWLIGVSKDSIESHKRFIDKYSLEIDLISDPELILHNELWVYWEKINYWKKSIWVTRSTFLVDSTWKVIDEWRNVKATRHVERILKEI